MDESHKEREHFFGAAKTIAALTIVSRVLGLIRDIVLVPLGGPVLADRFWTAFSVPNLFRRLFGEGALSAAFVPVFTDVAETQGWDKARLVLANIAGLVALLLGGLTVIIELCLLGGWLIWGGDLNRLVLLQLTGLMLPFMFTVCLLALGSAALNCKGHFAYPAFAPIILNVGLIAGAVWLAPALNANEIEQFMILALCLVVAGCVQLIGVGWLLKRAGLAAVAKIRPVLPEVKRIARLMAPMMLPLSVMQLSAFADRILALVFSATPGQANMPLQPGVVRCLYAANRLYQLPMGVLALSIATVVFPLFSRYAARKDTVSLRQTTNRALRLGAFGGIPAAVALIILAHPLIALIFQRQNFTAYDTERSAVLLQIYCLAMVAYFWNHVLLRAFFAQKDARTPLIAACLLSLANLAIVIAGVFSPLKYRSFALATALTSSANAAVLILVLRRRWGRIGLREILTSLVRIALATACMGIVVALVMSYVSPLAGRYLPGRYAPIATIAAAVIAGAGAFILAAAALRCSELKELWGGLRKRTTEQEV